MAASVQFADSPAAANLATAAVPLPILVHDFLLTPRGAERTFEEMAKCWPGAPVSTSLFAADEMSDRFVGHAVSTSPLQALGMRQSNFRALLPLFPAAFERLDVSSRELVVSSSSSFAHGVRPDEDAVHVAYCHSPFRYAWFERERALSEVPAPLRRPLDRLLERIRRWDVEAASRVTAYVANSRLTQLRIDSFYDRESVVIHPPVAVERFGAPRPHAGYFLYVGEITRHKQVEIAAKAATIADRELVVVGEGPDRERLDRLYGETVRFVGRVDDRELEVLLAQAAALVVPNVEEFGIAAVESMAAGRPVIGRPDGGTGETVVDNETGILIDDFSAGTLAEVMREVDFDRFDGAAIAAHAGQFSADRFRRELREFVAEVWAAK